MVKIIAASLMGIGILGFFGSFAWYSTMDEGVVWTKEQAENRVQTVSRSHQAATQKSLARTAKERQKREQAFEEAKAKSQASRSELDGAKSMRSTGAAILRYGGCALFLTGAITFLVIKGQEAN